MAALPAEIALRPCPSIAEGVQARAAIAKTEGARP
jgi:hypothetical protein